MKKRYIILSILTVLFVYLGFMPTPVDPVLFTPPPAETVHAPNSVLKSLQLIDLKGRIGPEDIVVTADGKVLAAVKSGEILKIDIEQKKVSVFANTGGRPLGLAFDKKGRLLVADPYKGLLRINQAGDITVLLPPGTADSSDQALCYANNVDVGPDGTIFVTDSTSRFCPPDYGGTYEASLNDILEHRKTGRLLALEPASLKAKVLVTGIQFANGVAVDQKGEFALLAETGDCRILKYHLKGPRKGKLDVVLSPTAGYPDNITRGRNGKFWIGFTKPRSKLMEKMADAPGMRRIVSRLPQFMFPVPAPFGHIIAIDGDGNVVARYQDDDPEYPDTTGATEVEDGLYVHSLHANKLGWLPNTQLAQTQ